MELTEFVDRYALERDVCAQYVAYLKLAAKLLAEWSGGRLALRDVTADAVNRWLREYQARYAPQTAAGKRRCIRSLLKAAEESGLIAPIGKLRSIRCPQLQPHAFSAAELSALMRHAKPRERAAILLAYDTGLRRSDLFDARWDQLSAGVLIRNQRKTGRRVTRRLRPETLAAMAAIRNGDHRLLGHLTPTIWRRAWRALGKRAGVDVRKRGLQAIRRTGATLSKKAGYSASDYLGHSPRSAGLAEQFYIDPRLLDESPPLPPPIG